jgi:hypothetical protein
MHTVPGPASANGEKAGVMSATPMASAILVNFGAAKEGFLAAIFRAVTSMTWTCLLSICIIFFGTIVLRFFLMGDLQYVSN